MGSKLWSQLRCRRGAKSSHMRESDWPHGWQLQGVRIYTRPRLTAPSKHHHDWRRPVCIIISAGFPNSLWVWHGHTRLEL